MAKTEELATTQTPELATPIDSAFLADLASELDGLGSISFDNVKIPSGGGLAFELPSDDPNNPDMAKELRGVIVAKQITNGYWKDPFGGDNKIPDCYSNDGKTGVISETGECRDCATCPLNQFKDDGTGKDCKNMVNLFIVREGEILPVRLVLPPTSIKNYRDYVAKRVVTKRKRVAQVVTGVTLTRAESKGGIKYSQAQFAKVRDLTPAEIEQYKPLEKLVAEVIAAQGHAPAADYEEAAPQQFEEITADEPLPFDNAPN